MMSGSERTIPAPEANPETKPFWDAAAEGKLLIKRCRACGEAHYYPRTLWPMRILSRSQSTMLVIMVTPSASVT